MLIHNPSSHQKKNKHTSRCSSLGVAMKVKDQRGIFFNPRSSRLWVRGLIKCRYLHLPSVRRGTECERLKSGAKTPLAAAEATATHLLEIFFKGTLESFPKCICLKLITAFGSYRLWLLSNRTLLWRMLTLRCSGGISIWRWCCLITLAETCSCWSVKWRDRSRGKKKRKHCKRTATESVGST